MERLNISNQTLREFIERPFHQKNEQKYLKYDARYQVYKKSNKIKVVRVLEFEKNYFIHITVPSESQKGATVYDVVVQFFTPLSQVERSLSLENYYVQFFSNSPGFIYKYAALYKLEGYLIESLFDKFQPGILDTLPDKANKDYELFYDSSIYYAARYLLDNKLRLLGKFNIKIFSTKDPKKFFEGVQDVESIGIIRDTNKFAMSLKHEINKDTKLSNEQEIKLKTSKNQRFGKEIFHKKNARKSTIRGSEGAKIIKGKKQTSKAERTPKLTAKKKITSTKSSRKK